MTTKAQKAAAEAAELALQQQAIAEPEYTPDDVYVMNIIEELGGETTARVRIYRQGATYSDMTLVHECSPEEFEPMILAHPPFNGGQFRIHIRSDNGIKCNRLLKVAPAADAVTPGVTTQAAPQTPTNNNGDIIALVSGLMTQMQNNTEKLIAAMKPSETDPLKTLEGIKAIAEIVKPAPVAAVAQGNDFFSTMKAVETFMGMTEKFKTPALTNDDGDVSIPAMLSMFVKEMRSRGDSERQAAPVVAGATAAIAPAVNANGLTPEQQTEMEDMQLLLKLQMRQASKAAAAGENPQEYAESIYGIIPEDVLTMIATEPNWFQELLKIAPECNAYAAWFQLVGAKLKAMAIDDGLVNTSAPLTTAAVVKDTPANGDIDAGAGSK